MACRLQYDDKRNICVEFHSDGVWVAEEERVSFSFSALTITSIYIYFIIGVFSCWCGHSMETT